MYTLNEISKCGVIVIFGCSLCIDNDLGGIWPLVDVEKHYAL